MPNSESISERLRRDKPTLGTAQGRHDNDPTTTGLRLEDVEAEFERIKKRKEEAARNQ